MHDIGTSKTRFLLFNWLFLHAANDRAWCLMSHRSKSVLFCELKFNDLNTHPLLVIWQPWVMHSFWLNCSYVIHILSDKNFCINVIRSWYWIGASLVTIQTDHKISWRYGTLPSWIPEFCFFTFQRTIFKLWVFVLFFFFWQCTPFQGVLVPVRYSLSCELSEKSCNMGRVLETYHCTNHQSSTTKLHSIDVHYIWYSAHQDPTAGSSHHPDRPKHILKEFS